jgi:Tfp pilus assembly protein PilN
MTIGALAAAVIVIAVATLFVRLWRFEHEYSKIQSRTAELFHKVLPEEKTIVDPLAQLEQKITSLQTGFAGASGAATSPLEILNQVTKTAPEQSGITVGSMLLSSDSVRITGSAGSFPPVYQWQQSLQQEPLFASVDVKDIQRLASDKPVSFTIVIALSKAPVQ